MVRSRIFIDIARRIIELIELLSLRGRAIALGILIAMGRARINTKQVGRSINNRTADNERTTAY